MANYTPPSINPELEARVVAQALAQGYAWYVYQAFSGIFTTVGEEVRVLLSPADQSLVENADLERYDEAEHGPLEDYRISWRSPHFSPLPAPGNAPGE